MSRKNKNRNFNVKVVPMDKKEESSQKVEVTFKEPVKEEKPVVKTKRVNSETGVNIRKTPSKDGKILYVVPYNSIVVVESTENGWTKVRDAGTTGYIMDEFLKEV